MDNARNLRYRYSYDNTSGRTFTESEWIAAALPHFVRLENDSDSTFVFFVAGIFADHQACGHIVPASQAAEREAVAELHCPFCDPRYNPATDLTKYPLSEKSLGSLCWHIEDIEGIVGIEPGDFVDVGPSSWADGSLDGLSGTVTRVYPIRGTLTVRNEKNHAEHLVRGSRVKTWHKKIVKPEKKLPPKKQSEPEEDQG